MTRPSQPIDVGNHPHVYGGPGHVQTLYPIGSGSDRPYVSAGLLEAVVALPAGRRVALDPLRRAAVRDAAVHARRPPPKPVRVLPIPLRREDPPRGPVPAAVRPDPEDLPDAVVAPGGRRHPHTEVGPRDLRDRDALRPRQATEGWVHLGTRLGGAGRGRSGRSHRVGRCPSGSRCTDRGRSCATRRSSAPASS